MIRFKFPEISAVTCLFLGSSSGGVNDLDGNISFETGDDPEKVESSRIRLAAALESEGVVNWAECRQVHQDTIITEPAPTEKFAAAASLPIADGLMTSIPNLALMIKTADCQPVLLAHCSGKFVMALHVGWRGNQIGFIQKAVARFCAQYGILPSDVFACRGPSLGPMHSEFVNFEKEWGDKFLPWFSPATRRMNLWKLTQAQLRDAGLPFDNIYEIDICTFENRDFWFSYRRNRQTGRQASLIWTSN